MFELPQHGDNDMIYTHEPTGTCYALYVSAFDALLSDAGCSAVVGVVHRPTAIFTEPIELSSLTGQVSVFPNIQEAIDWLLTDTMTRALAH